MANIIKLKRDVAATWVTRNQILEEGELGYESDTRKLKIGSGAAPWNTLKYIAGQNQSPELVKTLTLGAATFAHGLGAKPTSVRYGLRCLVANNGYAVGDEVFYGGAIVVFSWNATNIRISSTAATPSFPNATTGTSAAVTLASWQYFIQAFI